MEGLQGLFQSIAISQYKIYTYYYFLYYEQRSELQTKLSVCGRTEFKKTFTRFARGYRWLMKYSWFIREELSAYKAHVTHSAKHLSQEHTGSCFYKNKFHNGFITNYFNIS